MKSRGEQIKALSTAKQIITEVSSKSSLVQDGEDAADAPEDTEEVVLLQVARSFDASPAYQLVHYVRGLAKRQRSPSLAQLAIHMTSAVMHHRGASQEDVLAEVKGLIRAMIRKLEK